MKLDNLLSSNAQDEILFPAPPGSPNKNTLLPPCVPIIPKLGDVVWRAFNDDGTPDSQPDPAKTDNDFKEHKFSVSDLPPFTAFALKVVLTGTNSSYPPLIKDLRGIALAV